MLFESQAGALWAALAKVFRSNPANLESVYSWRAHAGGDSKQRLPVSPRTVLVPQENLTPSQAGPPDILVWHCTSSTTDSTSTQS